MAEAAIEVKKISKKYHIGRRLYSSSIRETLWGAVKNMARSRDEGRSKKALTQGEFWPLKDVSFTIQAGEVVGIIGKNGAGKSTLLKILSRITEPTNGEAIIRGRVASLLEIGTGFNPEMTGRENIYLNGAILGIGFKGIKKKFDEIVDFAGIGSFLDTPVKRYSSGMYIRLAFSVATHLESDILLLDEILAVGDANFQQKSLKKITEMALSGRTVILVTHNLSAVRNLCSRGILLEKGKLLFDGPAEQCVDKYLLKMSEKDLQTKRLTIKLKRPQYLESDSGLRITYVCLGSGKKGEATIETGSGINLKIGFRVRKSLKDVIIGFAIHTSEGIRVCECLTDEGERMTVNMKTGNYIAQVSLRENILNPGIYTLHAGARSGNQPLDWLQDVLTFRIVNNHGGTKFFGARQPSGIVKLKSLWQLKRI